MANIYGHSQWILDTAGVITTDTVRISKMEWAPNSADDDLLIYDNNAEAVWVTKAIAGGTAGRESWTPSVPFNALGFDLETIDGGTLYVWLC